jgi:hypothetical protein
MNVAPKSCASWQSRRLWSLWDMMDKYGFLFARAVLGLSEAKILCVPFQLQPGERQLSNDEIARAVTNGTYLMRQACIMSDMDGILPELDRLDDFVSPAAGLPFPPRGSIAHSIVHLISRLQDDLQQQFFFHLTQQDVRYYGQKDQFGPQVAKKFKDAAYDIENAGNCLALQQPTACVFHLMRAMEVSLRTLGKRLKVRIGPKDTLGKILNDISPKLNAMPDRTENQKRKKERWAEARANLFHVKQAWRDNSMHGKKIYDREHAYAIFRAVSTFMTHLASL